MAGKSNVFERNPVKTLAALLLILFVFLDFLAGAFLDLKRASPGAPGLYYRGRVLAPKEAIPGTQDLYTHHGLKKNISMKAKWGGEEYRIFTNSLGFKDKARRRVSLKGRPGTERLLILGDSFSEGIGCPYEVTFAGVLEKKLSPGVEVLNAAVSSYSPALYYLKLSRLLEDDGLKIDKLLVMIDISDIQDEIIYQKDFTPTRDWKPLWRLSRFLKDRSLLYPYFLKPREDALDAAAPRRAVWPTDTLLHQERGSWDGNEALYKKWGAEGLALAAKHMGQVAELCRRRGIELTIGVYPWPEQIKARRLNSKQVVFWRDFAGKEKTGFIDLFPHFIGKTPAEAVLSRYFIKGDVHWNAAGHALVAGALLPKLQK